MRVYIHSRADKEILDIVICAAKTEECIGCKERLIRSQWKLSGCKSQRKGQDRIGTDLELRNDDY